MWVPELPAFFMSFLTYLSPSEQDCDENLTVTIPQGTLRGQWNVTAKGTSYYMFLAIPYASPPVGPLRFLPPQPPKPWSGVRDAGSFGSKCCQLTVDNEILGDEDCLFVNVFTPKLPSSHSTLLPVMVWIHGGAFALGSSNIYPGQLMDRDIVFVSMNYRLNVFGFLSLDGTDATGNAGLKDQSAALRWVQKNIVHFGGDRHSVTIFGQSAGGASVHYHLLSPMSRGLFHKAISQSGSALNPWTFSCSTQHHAFRLGYLVAGGADNTQDLINDLRAAPARVLTSSLFDIFSVDINDSWLPYPFVPTMEHCKAGEEPFLLESPECMQTVDSFTNVPYIMGTNVKEATAFIPEYVVSRPSYWQGVNNDLEQIVPLNLGLPKGSKHSLEVASIIKSFYFGDQEISYETKDQWLNLQADLNFILGVQNTLYSRARFSDVMRTYSYQFVYNNATHSDELQYIFYSGNNVNEESNDATLALAELFGDLWTSFAKIGVPTTKNYFLWKPVSKNALHFLKIDTVITMDMDLKKETMDFWTNIYRKFRQTRLCCR